MENSVKLRNFELKDVGDILDIYNYYIEKTVITFEEKPLSEAVLSERLQKIANNNVFIVAEKNGLVVGYAYLSDFNERTAYRFTKDLSIYVDKDCRKLGIGEILYAEIERLAKSTNVKNIISIITAENETSVKFHEKNGFIKIGEFPEIGYKFDRWLNVSYYQKAIK